MREKWQGRDNYIQLYIPNRTAIVLCAEENLAKYGLTIGGRGAKLAADSTITAAQQLLASVKLQ
jgi:hypothetical protein